MITYVDPADDLASAGATAAATAWWRRVRRDGLARTTELANLTKQAAGLDLAVRTLDATLVQVRGGTRPSKQAPLSALPPPETSTELLTQVSVVNGPGCPGPRREPRRWNHGRPDDRRHRNEDPWRISMLSVHWWGCSPGRRGHRDVPPPAAGAPGATRPARYRPGGS